MLNLRLTFHREDHMPYSDKYIINHFRGDFYFLSNFFPCTIEVEVGDKTHTFPSVEHAFQAKKWEIANTEESPKKIKRFTDPELTPGGVKQFGRKVPLTDKQLRKWESIKVDWMYTLLRKKFSNEDLRKRLLQTYDARIVEENDHGDKFWGTYKGKGENNLGRLLTRVRAKLAAKYPEDLREEIPPHQRKKRSKVK